MNALLVDGPALDVVLPVLLLKGTLVVVPTLLLEEEALPPKGALLVEERRYSCEYSCVLRERERERESVSVYYF